MSLSVESRPLFDFTKSWPKKMSDSEDEVAERQFKMVLIGDPQVGKTSMVTRYAKEMFTKQGPHSIEKSLT